MGTRSLIGKMNKDGSITAIYCHWDGYPEYNGKILVNHYTKESKIDRLLQLGSISSLAPNIGKKNSFDKPDRRYCVAYGRDRGDNDTAPTTYRSFEMMVNDPGWTEYLYVWDENNGWRCFSVYGNEWIALDGPARIAA